jgi:hypothetical protein
MAGSYSVRFIALQERELSVVRMAGSYSVRFIALQERELSVVRMADSYSVRFMALQEPPMRATPLVKPDLVPRPAGLYIQPLAPVYAPDSSEA